MMPTATDAQTAAATPARRLAKDQLKSLVERIQRLQEEKKALGDDIADVYREAKGNGFDAKALRIVVRKLGQDRDARAEEESLVELYLSTLGAL